MLTRKNDTCQDCHVELRVEREGDVYFIVPHGQMLAGEGDLRLKQEFDRLRGEGNRRIAIDFSGVPYIDSSVLGQLVHGYSMLKKEGGGLKLLSPPKRIIDLLSLTRLITVFEIYQSREDILESWKART
jgi:anti-sigma B factor antagonist